MNYNKKYIQSLIVANFIDHYDVALYSFLAPFIASLYFPFSDPVVSLIVTYGVMSLPIFARPLGAIFFGKMAVKYSPDKSLSYSLYGIAIATFIIGITPSYKEIGIIAPIIVGLCRIMQGFFSSGESSVAGMYILSMYPENKFLKVTSIYQSSTMLGILVASFVSSIFMHLTPNNESVYRLLFIAAGIIGSIATYIRNKSKPDYQKEFEQKHSMKIDYKKFGVTVILSGFSYVVYAIPFVFLNNFVPIISNGKISYAEMISYATALMVFDLAIIIFSGFLKKFSSKKALSFIAFSYIIINFIGFYFLPKMNILEINIFRLVIITLGVAFCVLMQIFNYGHYTGKDKYLIPGTAYSIGSEIFGRSATSICLFLWHFTQYPLAPWFYILFISIAVILCLSYTNFKIK